MERDELLGSQYLGSSPNPALQQAKAAGEPVLSSGEGALGRRVLVLQEGRAASAAFLLGAQGIAEL